MQARDFNESILNDVNAYASRELLLLPLVIYSKLKTYEHFLIDILYKGLRFWVDSIRSNRSR